MGRVHAYTTSAAPPRRLPVLRALDLVLASLMLVLVLPLMGVLALLVRRSSHGPVLHRERMRDRKGRSVEVLSFRVTRDGGATDAPQRIRAVVGAGELPLTGIGRFLHATRLDRLPRLFSVVAGHATLLG